MSYKSLRELKQQVKELIENIDGVGGIGLAWDELGKPILRIDIDDDSTRSLVEERLSILELKINSKNEIEISDNQKGNFINNYNIRSIGVSIGNVSGSISQSGSVTFNDFVEFRKARQTDLD